MREAARRSFEISEPALAELPLSKTPAGAEVVGAAVTEPEGREELVGAGAAEIVIGMLTFVWETLSKKTT